jgi:DNA mismatch repair ATPase MutS
MKTLLNISLYLSVFVPLIAKFRALFCAAYLQTEQAMVEVVVHAERCETEIQTDIVEQAKTASLEEYNIKVLEAERLLAENNFVKELIENLNKENEELKLLVEAERMYNKHECTLDVLMMKENYSAELIELDQIIEERDRTIEKLQQELTAEKNKLKAATKSVVTNTKIQKMVRPISAPRRPFQTLNFAL